MARVLSTVAFAVAVTGIAYLLYSPGSDGVQPSSRDSPERPVTALLDSLLARPILPEPPSADPPATPFFDLDQHGRLLPSARSAIELDVLLAQLSGAPSRDELLRLENRVSEGLPDNARADAVRIFHAYLQYKNAEAEFESRPEDSAPVAAEERFRQLVALRRHYLGPQVADTFFGEREAVSWYGIQASRIEADPTQNVEQKLTRLADLKKRMPAIEPHLSGDDATARTGTVEWQVALMRERGASEDEIRHLRERMLDRTAVQAISAMEAQNAEWERRYQSFRQEAMAVRATSLSKQHKQQYVEVLLRRHYRDDELQAVRGYDQEYVRR